MQQRRRQGDRGGPAVRRGQQGHERDGLDARPLGPLLPRRPVLPRHRRPHRLPRPRPPHGDVRPHAHARRADGGRPGPGPTSLLRAVCSRAPCSRAVCSRAVCSRRRATCSVGSSARERVDDREADEHAEHPERHPPPEQRGHRAGSGTGTVARSGTNGTEVTRTRGRRCDS